MTVKMKATTEEKQAISYKGEKRKSCTMQFKKEVFQYVDDRNVRKAATAAFVILGSYIPLSEMFIQWTFGY